MNKALISVLAFGLLTGCTSGELSVPDPVGVTEVPYGGGPAPMTGADTADFAALPDGVQRAPAGITTADAAPGIGRPLDTDTLNLMQTTLEEQKIDAAVAQRKLDEDRAKLVIVQPGALPTRVDGVNVALFAQQTTNAVGEKIYDRAGGFGGFSSACRKFTDPDDAQRAFLASGGPQSDQYGLDPNGDGFACSWDPTPYRELKL
jgi:hypothetical protein